MYKLFCAKYPQCSVSRPTYTDIFQLDFNLRCGLLCSDTCTFCDKIYIKLVVTPDGPERNAILVDSELHHARAEAGYKALKLDAEKANPQLVVRFTYLQQVLYCPTLTHSSVFYQRQYTIHNYDIHDAGSNDSTMMWHESIATKNKSTQIVPATTKSTEPRWDQWTQWSPCSVSCGKGRNIRWRHCRENCREAETEMEEKSCQMPACPQKLFGLIKL
ncbi:unnamed protein product [Diabrotica balteata]|uniref:Uncharacterized protein n=1 Tax=Diabrotica balteata TaxID=107213 RepID=A0A9N9TCS2_DIABA|nr:unnamed protein product [Diabrotica balteata]